MFNGFIFEYARQDSLNIRLNWLWDAWKMSLSYGIRGEHGVAHELTDSIDERLIMDFVYYLVIVSILRNIFFGIIIDTFGKLRETEMEHIHQANNTCFVCGVAKIEFDKRSVPGANSFKMHREVTANLIDMNKDGLLDILVADGRRVRPFMGKVNLAFLPGPSIEAGPRPVDVCLADLNNDGLNDLVVANELPFADIEGDLAVLLNTGGALKAHAIVEAGRRTPDVAAGDFNGDGNVDVIAASFATGHVALLHGDGTGALGRRVDLPAGRGAHRLAVADVNGDGRSDIVCANRLDDTVTVFVGGASARVPPPPVRGASIGAIGMGFGLFGPQSSGGWAAAAPAPVARSSSAPAPGAPSWLSSGGGGDVSATVCDSEATPSAEVAPSAVSAEDAARIFSFLE